MSELKARVTTTYKDAFDKAILERKISMQDAILRGLELFFEKDAPRPVGTYIDADQTEERYLRILLAAMRSPDFAGEVRLIRDGLDGLARRLRRSTPPKTV